MLVMASAFLLLKSQNNTHSLSGVYASALNANEGILANDRLVLERNLRTRVLHDPNWIKVNDFSIGIQELVDSENAKDMFKISNDSLDDLESCLKKDFCGMERRSEDDSYFDDGKTPGHILLGRNLEILLQSLKFNPELSNRLDWDLIRELTESANEKVQVLALKLLKDYKTNESDTARLLKIAENFKGKAKADALIFLSDRNANADREMILNSLEKSFANDDPNTAISVVEKLGKMNLLKSELERIAKYLCHYKEKGADEHNWKMIDYQMGKLDVDLDNICN